MARDMDMTLRFRDAVPAHKPAFFGFNGLAAHSARRELWLSEEHAVLRTSV
jgi:hypothetical protein